MMKGKTRGMQGLSAECGDDRLCRLWQALQPGVGTHTIKLIAQNRMADMGHVHPDLMGSPGRQSAGKLCRSHAPASFQREMGQR